jgi:hypothetical protein
MRVDAWSGESALSGRSIYIHLDDADGPSDFVPSVHRPQLKVAEPGDGRDAAIDRAPLLATERDLEPDTSFLAEVNLFH